MMEKVWKKIGEEEGGGERPKVRAFLHWVEAPSALNGPVASH